MDNWRAQIVVDSPNQAQVRRAFQVSLWLGGGLVVLVSLLALFGPQLAPRDPLQENYVVYIDDALFVKPPFAAFSVPGFPLGSDEFGRDIFSRLLWSIRPTMTLVLVVASVRLIVGLLLGLMAGWSRRLAGRVLNILTSLSLSVPVLFIALFIIAALGQRYGVWAFIIGLMLTGWADAARLVRERTRQIRSQPFVEAATALGSGSVQNLFSHILPQIVPLVWTLLAFEVSGTLLVTAELGVLGYFINAIWIPVGDWTTLRASGAPELGQMLSDLQHQPWGGFAAGIVVFITILAFNLLGDGLRETLSLEGRPRRKDDPTRSVGTWIEEQVFNPLTPLRRQLPTIGLIAFLVLAATGGGYALWATQTPPQPVQAVTIPGGHAWASSYRDAQGTLFSPIDGPQRNPKIAWDVDLKTEFSGGPVISASGVLYIASAEPKLHAIDPTGKELWSADLPEPPVGTPAIGPSGNIYITGRRGGLTLVTPEGKTSVVINGQSRAPALSGPVLSSDGTIFYPTSSELVAVSSDGKEKWRQPLPTYSKTDALVRLAGKDTLLVYESYLIDTRDGSLADFPPPNPLEKILVGTDNKTYRLSQTSLVEVAPGSQQASAGKGARWDVRTLGTSVRYPRDAGVVADGKIWILYGSTYDYGRLLWLDAAGSLLQSIDMPYRGTYTRMIGIDRGSTSFLCGVAAAQGDPTRSGSTQCMAFQIQSAAPLWKIELQAGAPAGGAVVENRLYLTTADGHLVAIDGE